MNEQPSTVELLTAVKSFVEKVAVPKLTGHEAFHGRVALNVLDTLIRDVSLRPQAEADQLERLKALLGKDGTLSDLNQELADLIRESKMTLDTAGLLDHLKKTTIDQLNIDQPKYSGLKSSQA